MASPAEPVTTEPTGALFRALRSVDVEPNLAYEAAGPGRTSSPPRTDQSFLVPKGEIAGNDYDLSINRYKEVEYEAVEYDPPKVILGRLAALEKDIAKGREELERLLG